MVFKLMIIDDEDNTREGIAERISWDKIGISQIEQADDGVNALKKALDFKPDIILTDVRMPRMDGIELSFKLREVFPECVIIFMSGYADKIYLKSAIQLKAVSYLEKPINLQELAQAVKDAVQLCIDIQKKKETEKSLSLSISLVKSELALLLQKKAPDRALIIQQINAATMDLPEDAAVITLLVRIFPITNSYPVDTSIKNFLIENLQKITMQSGIQCISTFKDDHNIMIHLFSDACKKHLLTEDKLKNIISQIVCLLENSYRYFISIGKKVNGILNTYESYESALIGLRKAFFQGYNCIVFYNRINEPVFEFRSEIYQDFKLCIEKENCKQTIFYIKKLTSELKRFDSTPPSNVREFYFRLLLDLCKSAEMLQFTIINDFTDRKHMWEYFFKIRTLDELANSLIYYIEVYYKILDERSSNNRIINIVTNYIKDNFHDESLSITKISEYVHLAPTYLCSLFKEKTGKTLNQYITEFRVDKSKELLLNSKYKISDVTSMVGLRDQGYFTKIFRKITGMTPSEYILNK